MCIMWYIHFNHLLVATTKGIPVVTFILSKSYIINDLCTLYHTAKILPIFILTPSLVSLIKKLPHIYQGKIGHKSIAK